MITKIWHWIQRNGLWLLLVVVALKQAWLIGVVPIWHVPDETTHVQFVQSLVEERRFPLFAIPEVFYSREIITSFLSAKNLDQGHAAYRRFMQYPVRTDISDRQSVDPRVQPGQNFAATYGPPYYLLEALPYLAFYNASIETRVLAMRAVSSLLLLVMTFFAYRIGRLLRPDGGFAFVLAVIIGFQPMLGYMMAGVNIDNFLAVMTTISCWAFLRVLMSPSRAAIIIAAVAVGLGAMAKQSGWILIPVFVFVLWLIRSELPRSRWLKWCGLGLGVALGIGSSWVLRSLITDPTNILTVEDVKPFVRSFEFTVPWLLKMDIFFRLPFVFTSYWGYFGWASERVFLPFDLYEHLAAVVVMSIAGWIVVAFNRSVRAQLSSLEKKFSAISLAGVVLLEAGYQYLWWDRALNFQILHFPVNGRYYLFMIVPFTILVLFGLLALLPKRAQPWMLTVTALAVTALGLYAAGPVLLHFPVID